MKKAALRKFAWRDDPTPDKGEGEYYNCRDCLKQGTGRLSLPTQASRNCARPYFDTSTWTGTRIHLRFMGAQPRYDREGKDSDWQKPKEDPRVSGCPGSWYADNDGFVGSLLERYYRRRDDNGGRIANLALDRCDNPLVIEAINALEMYESAWRSEHYRKIDESRKK